MSGTVWFPSYCIASVLIPVLLCFSNLISQCSGLGCLLSELLILMAVISEFFHLQMSKEYFLKALGLYFKSLLCSGVC